MGVWEFVLVYLGAFLVVQLVLYRYLRNRSGERTGFTFAGPPNADHGPGEGPGQDRGEAGRRRELRDRQRPEERADADADDAVRRCPNCGATNDPSGSYTFCRNCASRLAG